jgi:hypothetical protein
MAQISSESEAVAGGDVMCVGIKIRKHLKKSKALKRATIDRS